MKITKILLLLLISCFVFSCSQDAIDKEEQVLEIFELSKYDDSNLGVYKGVFTTLDGLDQGEVIITLLENQFGTAELFTSTGELLRLKSDYVESFTNITGLEFKTSPAVDSQVTFSFSVDDDGKNSLIEDVVYKNKASHILIAKHSSRAPANTIPGTYTCTNCDTLYPSFGNGNSQTFNLLGVTGMDDTTYTASVTFNGSVFTSEVSQTICSEVLSFGVFCSIEGEKTIGGQNLEYEGVHQYKNDGGDECSYVEGTWTLPLNGSTLEGDFVSNQSELCN